MFAGGRRHCSGEGRGHQTLQVDRTPARLGQAGKIARKAGQKEQADALLREAVLLGQQGIPTQDWEPLLAKR